MYFQTEKPTLGFHKSVLGVGWRGRGDTDELKGKLKGLVNRPWLVWLSGLHTGLRTKELPVRFPVGTCLVRGQVPS